MSPTASQERKPQSRVYTEDEWEKVRQPFQHYYVEKNLPLKEAVRLMSEHYQFDATPRQWERRIAPEKWNLTKYTNRSDRLRQIENSGKSLLEVSQRGRRKSTASDGRPVLNEDRNLRRFARRETNRAPRARAKSVGTSSDVSDEDRIDSSAAPSPAVSDASLYACEPVRSTQFTTAQSDHFDEPWSQQTAYGRLMPPSIQISDLTMSEDKNELPQITFSDHDSLGQAMTRLPSSSEFVEPSRDYPQTQVDPSFSDFARRKGERCS